MAVKKIYSDYQSYQLRDVPQMQRELEEMKSYTEEHYISQREAFNQKQKYDYDRIQQEEWDKWETRKREMNENLRKYSEKYYEILRTHYYSTSLINTFVFQACMEYNIFKIIAYKTMAHDSDEVRIAKLDPKNLKIPDEPPPVPAPAPTLLTDVKMFRDRVEGRVRELEYQIEKLKTEIANAMSLSQDKPLSMDNGRWLYQDCVYEVTGGHSFDEICLLIMEFADKERRKFERLKNKFSGTQSEELKYERIRIPEEVRIAVWRRDQGRCARCGSRENLEYDHIVPVSKGGGSTERNIELLCQDCNRTKGNRIE